MPQRPPPGDDDTLPFAAPLPRAGAGAGVDDDATVDVGLVGATDLSSTMWPGTMRSAQLSAPTLAEGGVQLVDSALRAGTVLVGRYRLDVLLGVGGFGEVWSAVVEDSHTPTGAPPERVAIKLLPALSDKDLIRVRREVAALRWARLPGVVRMLDDGLLGHDYFIVMEQVTGEPFPGRRVPLPWPQVREPALALLEILARVHHSGLIHRDLKPQNILVDEAGVPTLLDLGIAAGRALSEGFESRAFTPAYAAPEQIRREECDERADLYAIGVMLYEALTGTLPHAPHLRLEATGPLPPPPLDIPGLSPDVRALLRRLLSPDPADRPASALEVIAAMGGQLPPLLGGGGLDLPPRSDAFSLRALFHGPDAFLHLREDAADELWARTRGEKSAIEAELGAWLRAGLTHWEDDALRIDRAAIERLQGGLRLALDDAPPPTDPAELTLLRWLHLAWPEATRDSLAAVVPLPQHAFDAAYDSLLDSERIWHREDGRTSCRLGGRVLTGWPLEEQRRAHQRLSKTTDPYSAQRLRHRLKSGVNIDNLTEDIVDIIKSRIKNGETKRLHTMLHLGFAIATQAKTRDSIEKICRLFALWALEEYTSHSINIAQYIIDRARYQNTHVRLLLKSKKELLSISHESAQSRIKQIRKSISELPTIKDEQFEIHKMQIYVATIPYVSFPESEEGILKNLNQWAINKQRKAKLWGWMGNNSYRLKKYASAASLHMKAAANKHSDVDRISSLLNAASAHLENLNLVEAQKHAATAIGISTTLRHARYEALGVWIVRQSEYRNNLPLKPRRDYISSGAIISKYISSLFAFTESAISWRCGDIETAKDLLAIALEFLGSNDHMRLIRAFAIYLGIIGVTSKKDIQDIIKADDERIKAQCIAIMCRKFEDHIQFTIPATSHILPINSPHMRVDLLSIDEISNPNTIPLPPRVPQDDH